MAKVRTFAFAALAAMVSATGAMSCKDKSAPAAAEETAQTEDTAYFQDFSQPSISGDTLSLREEMAKNKVTVVDFWASWCGPCRREMPGMVAMYSKYKDRGLGIIGISLDQDRSAWEAAVAADGLAWTHVSELRGWDNTAARAYGVQGIPYTMVVDSEGKIMHAGLRGAELENAVAALLDGGATGKP